MERIIIEVDDVPAKKWRLASGEKKQTISKTIEKLINHSLSQNDDNFWQFINAIGEKLLTTGLPKKNSTGF